LVTFHSCMGDHSTEHAEFVVLITAGSHFAQFLLYCSASTQKFTQLLNLHIDFRFNKIWRRQPVTALIFCRRPTESDNTVIPSVTCIHSLCSWYYHMSLLFSSSAALSLLTNMIGNYKSLSPSAFQVKICEIRCNKPTHSHTVWCWTAHSSICTDCVKGKGTAVSVLVYCRLEIIPGGWGSKISRHLSHDRGQVLSPTYCPHLPCRCLIFHTFFRNRTMA